MANQDGIGESEKTTEKRFVLSKEPFAKERIEAVKRVVHDMKAVHPEVLSFCMFGSMTNGRANPDSDIDGYLFVDVTKTAEKISKEPKDILQTLKPEDGSIRTYFVPEVENEYSGLMRQELMDRLNLTPEQVQHVRVRPISEQIINEHIEDLRGQVKELRDFNNRVAEWESRNPEGSDKPIQEVLDYYEQRPKHPSFPSPSVTLQSMFHLQVGNGIQSYRAHLINQLSGMGEEGEDIWKTIIQGTEGMESHLRTNTGKSYPRTIEEAKKIYSQREDSEQVGSMKEENGKKVDWQLDAEKAAQIKDQVSKAANFLNESGVPWYLVGGLGLELSNGIVTRDHPDMDVAIFRDNIGAFYDYVASKGGRVFRSLSKEQLDEYEKRYGRKPEIKYQDEAHVQIYVGSREEFVRDTYSPFVTFESGEIDLDIIDANPVTGEIPLPGDTDIKFNNSQYKDPEVVYVNGEKATLGPQEITMVHKILQGKEKTRLDLANTNSAVRAAVEKRMSDAGLTFKLNDGTITEHIQDLISQNPGKDLNTKVWEVIHREDK